MGRRRRCHGDLNWFLSFARQGWSQDCSLPSEEELKQAEQIRKECAATWIMRICQFLYALCLVFPNWVSTEFPVLCFMVVSCKHSPFWQVLGERLFFCTSSGLLPLFLLLPLQCLYVCICLIMFEVFRAHVKAGLFCSNLWTEPEWSRAGTNIFVWGRRVFPSPQEVLNGSTIMQSSHGWGPPFPSTL